ncbi:MAG: 50S ribosomal protein L10 [Candidatus Tagabacteria bacterium CG_4_10_14_0_2_um_filter_40_13]|uniref:Large ribosomal subunit protein uL10 n=3 Tax=Candidatus Tagaibacteriota TaxID=1817918 RepID=A0A2M8G9D6_9BACT|nr:MAG: 50S ribosomal protein L10 [Candidatus Tagabacteria bacterium CG03_land_8_20_14_0_80_41_22]PIZ56615.1 MAG: 50S ribosomal protein L10 [Candidatus Tagabacteria bacterium CG_4_10_14_0_2_um_filter_40_13]PJC25286.1 MAG: 50S ribosomal protein L10 [Candidatus Tagabacteria bacterium CG_4_9_14_0_2_um_filter_41_11]PJC70061.1 MAG: 50S ribosomal protein L10 [Candidatus Tagabacteria bacterium CG_4_8_14_3_um_filter_41_8]
MATTRQKKETILQGLTGQFKEAQMVIFVNFHGLSTAATRKLRKLLRTTGSQYKVAKKTLIKKAMETLNVIGDMPNLEGEIALIFGADNLPTVAKSLIKFIKENKEMAISGGILENKFIGSKMVSELAAIPTREILLAKLVYVINSPRQRLVGALGGDLRKFANILSQIRK